MVLSRSKNYIISLDSIILDREIMVVEESNFHSLINPQYPIPELISDLTPITNETDLPFPNVMIFFCVLIG